MASSTHPLQEGSFDPLALLRGSRGDGSELRDIKLRMLWLRQRVPEAQVETELVTLDERVVVMAAAISLPDGARGSGHAVAMLSDSDDVAEAIETTELRAIGRALDILGYVITEESSAAAATAPDRPSPAPPSQRETQGSRQPPEHVRAIRSMREREQQQAPAPSLPDIDDLGDEPEEALPEAPAPEPPFPVSTAPERPREQPATTPRPAPHAPADDDEEPPLEDVSWTAFWNWARAAYQLRSRNQVEDLLGQPIDKEVPGTVRRLLIAHFDKKEADES